MNPEVIKEMSILIWKHLEIANELSNKLGYEVKFMGIRKVTSDMISSNLMFKYGYPISDDIKQLDVPIEKLENIDNIVKEIIENYA